MRCEACGHTQPDPKPVIVEKVKEVYVGDNAFWIRICGYILAGVVAIVLGIGFEEFLMSWSYRKALDAPGVKIEETRYDANGRQTMKVTR